MEYKRPITAHNAAGRTSYDSSRAAMGGRLTAGHLSSDLANTTTRSTLASRTSLSMASSAGRFPVNIANRSDTCEPHGTVQVATGTQLLVSEPAQAESEMPLEPAKAA
jgi:hypothetical protein